MKSLLTTNIKCPRCSEYQGMKYLNDAHKWWFECLNCKLTFAFKAIKNYYNQYEKIHAKN